jgi:hypothetical protein
LTCRAPSAPGELVWEYATPRLRTAAAYAGELFALTGDRVEVYAFGIDGSLSLARTLPLRRAGHDMAVFHDVLLVADAQGLSVYRLRDGALLASLETCGKARRVFVDDPWVYVVGLRSILVVDAADPATPAVAARLRLRVRLDGLDVTSCSTCTWVDRTVDRLCDLTGACGAFGRPGAAYADGRLFLNLLGMLYVVDMRSLAAPTVAARVPVGLLTDMQVEGRFLYGNKPGRCSTVVARDPSGAWALVGQHDVPRWVEGVAETDEWTVHWGPGRLQVARRQ